MTEQERRSGKDRRTSSVRGASRRKRNTPVKVERRSGKERRAGDRRSGRERRSTDVP